MAAASEVENVILLMDMFDDDDEVMEAIHGSSKQNLLLAASICERKRKKPITWKEQRVALVESNGCPLGVQLVNSVQTNKTSSPNDLVELAKQVQKADEFTRATACSKLTVIADQIRYLQEQARKVLETAQRDNVLHHAACNLVKKPGNIYYMYMRDTGQHYFSILSPQEWGASCPHKYIAAYRLEHDMSWTPIEDLDQRSNDIAVIDKIYNARISESDPSITIQHAIESSEFLQIKDVSDHAECEKLHEHVM